MAAGKFTLFEANLDDLRLADLSGTANLRLALVASAYTPSSGPTGHSLWADVSTNELAAANGYATGGAALTSAALLTAAKGFALDSADVVWTAAGGDIAAHRYYVMYYLGTLWGKTNPLIGYFVGDTTPADIPATTAGNTLTVTVPAAGWFSQQQA